MKVICVLAVAFCATPITAVADEIWVCDFPGLKTNIPDNHYRLHDKHFILLSQFPMTYNVLINDNAAIVAAKGTGIDFKEVGQVGPPPYPNPAIEADAIAIDRKTGNAATGVIDVYEVGPPSVPVHGTCHQQKPGEPGAIWPKDMKSEAEGSSK